MDVVNYALTKKMVASVSSGIVEVQTDGTNIRFKTANGDWFSVRLNSVDGATISSNGHLIIELTDGTTLDAGALPVGTMDSSLSKTSENGVQNKVITNALGDLNLLCNTKLSIVESLPITPHNQETVLYVGTSDDGLKCGGIYQYQVSEWVMISNVSSFTFNSDEFAVDSTTNEVSLKPSYADIPSFLPNNVSSSNKLATMDKLGELPLYSGNLNDLHPNGFAKYKATYSDLTNTPTVSYTPQMCYIDVWSDTANIYQMIRIVGVTYNPIADYSNMYIRSSHYTGSEYVWSAWGKVCTTTVEDVPITYINTFEDETYVKPTTPNVCSYYVSNGNCIITIESFCLSTSTSFTQIISGLPKPKTTLYANAIDRTISVNSGARGLFQLTRDGDLNIVCDYGDTSVVTSRYFYVSFSYSVAES